MREHWSWRYLGQPWVPGISDCWSLARRVWAEEFGRAVPPLPVDPADLRAGARAIAAGLADWHPSFPPAEGDAVLMAMGRHPAHVGVWVAPDRVLHSLEGAGVLCTPADCLSLHGWRIVDTYRHRDWGLP